MQSLAAARAVLSPDCYAIALKILCIMIVPFCSSDGYIVRMYNYTICKTILHCGAQVFGENFISDICDDLTSDYTTQLYNGTDDFTYQIMDENAKIKGTTDGTTPLFSIITTYIVIFTLPFQLLVLNYYVL